MEDEMTENTNSYETLRETGAELGRTAATAIDARLGSVAKGLDDVAHGLHGGADSVATKGTHVSRITHGAADTVESAAQYVRDHDTTAIVTDLRTLVQTHPGKSLLAFLAVGYLAGRALQRAWKD
jgi:hypothetical protein